MNEKYGKTHAAPEHPVHAHRIPYDDAGSLRLLYFVNRDEDEMPIA
jgi:hypothetical protein